MVIVGADASYITGGFRPAEDAHSRDHFWVIGYSYVLTENKNFWPKITFLNIFFFLSQTKKKHKFSSIQDFWKRKMRFLWIFQHKMPNKLAFKFKVQVIKFGYRGVFFSWKLWNFTKDGCSCYGWGSLREYFFLLFYKSNFSSKDQFLKMRDRSFPGHDGQGFPTKETLLFQI